MGDDLKRIFGPVPSRRLGLSLGIDVIPYKTCSFDCIYCECGQTTRKTCTREEFFPLSAILGELDTRLAGIRDKPDVLTLSGAGEPTLYSRMGELIIEAKRMSGLPVAVITNSSLLSDPVVREELGAADIILPSLDAAIEETFERINRPHEECDLHGIVTGLECFLERYRGTVLFEVMLIGGINTNDHNLTTLGNTLERFRFDRLQLNTAVRPGTDRSVEPLGETELNRIRCFFGDNSEMIAPASARASHEEEVIEDKILSLIERRPCTLEDIHRSLGIPLQGLVKFIDVLSREGRIVTQDHGGTRFFTAAQRE